MGTEGEQIEEPQPEISRRDYAVQKRKLGNENLIDAALFTVFIPILPTFGLFLLGGIGAVIGLVIQFCLAYWLQASGR